MISYVWFLYLQPGFVHSREHKWGVFKHMHVHEEYWIQNQLRFLVIPITISFTGKNIVTLIKKTEKKKTMDIFFSIFHCYHL